jgi:glycosyltransferase involved in cell wall biosynthesis
MLKILFITDNFPPEVNAPATRTIEHCIEWKKLGADITVLTCAPNFPQGKVYEGYKNKLYQKEVVDGITVIRVWSYITRNKGFIKRILDYISFGVSSFFTGLFVQCDVIVATSPQFFTTTTACCLSFLKRKPWIFELRDLWPESIKTVGAMKDNTAIRLLEKIELFLYKNANKVIPVTNAFKMRLESRGIASEQMEVITNGANLDLYNETKEDSLLIDELELNGKFVIGYIGTHGLAHSLDFIVNSIAEIKDKKIHFIFVGDGAKKDEIIAIRDNLKLKNITFIDPVKKEMMPQMLSIIDVALVPLIKSDTFKTVIPSKIFESSAMKKPILLGVEGQAKDIIKKYNAGLCFEPENKEEFIDCIHELINNKTLYRNLQEGCTKLANDFDRKKLAKKMYNVIEGVVLAGK